jgi:hypothetical protein
MTAPSMVAPARRRVGGRGRAGGPTVEPAAGRRAQGGPVFGRRSAG